MKRWTPKLASSRTRRHINAAIKQLAKVALEWEDVDQSYVDELQTSIDELEALRDTIIDEIDERLALGEKIGL